MTKLTVMFSWQNAGKPIIALAPMADMTDSAFCRTVKRLSADVVVFREMVSAEALVRGSAKTMDMTAFSPDERPIVQQVFGADPGAVSEAVKIIDGQSAPDAFDINMGCPAHKIVGGFNGAALMRRPDLAADIVRAAKAATTRPVSVKTRLGWTDPTEILEFIKVLEAAGADLVTIHGRTRTQGYSGKANWSMIGRARELVRVPVLANGDIVSGDDAVAAIRTSGCAGVMIGRGALGNPWVFGEIEATFGGQPYQPPTIEERIAVVRAHALLHAAGSGGDEPLRTFRKHLAWYFRGGPGAKTLRQKLVRVSTMAELDDILDELSSGRQK